MRLYTARQILGVSAGASKHQAKQALRRQQKRWHPDRPGGCLKKFHAVIEAYNVVIAEIECEEPLGGLGAAPRAGAFETAEHYPEGLRPNRSRPEQKRSEARSPEARPKPDLETDWQKGIDRRGRGIADVNPPGRARLLSGGSRLACQALLERDGVRQAVETAKARNAGCYSDPRLIATAQKPSAAGRVAETIRVDQGRVKIELREKLRPGENRIAVPQGTRENDKPTILRVLADNTGNPAGELSPEELSGQFGWAERVEVVIS